MSEQASSSHSMEEGVGSSPDGSTGDISDQGEVDTAYLRQPSVMTRMLW
jgi:hypothetical protein